MAGKVTPATGSAVLHKDAGGEEMWLEQPTPSVAQADQQRQEWRRSCLEPSEDGAVPGALQALLQTLLVGLVVSALMALCTPWRSLRAGGAVAIDTDYYYAWDLQGGVQALVYAQTVLALFAWCNGAWAARLPPAAKVRRRNLLERASRAALLAACAGFVAAPLDDARGEGVVKTQRDDGVGWVVVAGLLGLFAGGAARGASKQLGE